MQRRAWRGAVAFAACTLTMNAAQPARAATPRAPAVVAFPIAHASARDVARQLAAALPQTRVSLAGGKIVVAGSRADLARAKSLVAAFDRFAAHAPKGTLALAPVAQAVPAAAPPGSAFEIYTLRAALPGLNGNPSSTAADIATTVTQALGPAAPDLRITVSTTSPQLVLTGNPASIRTALDLLERLDVAQKLVVLDTQILEVDESVAKDLGLSFPQPVISTTFSEVTPPPDALGNPQRIAGFQAIQRTPLSLPLQLNLLIRNGKARVLANPRITTISGRTATIRAGDTIAIETTAGGGAGTVATTQIQTFQTGVTLDITPVVNADNYVTVTLHPSVNSETGIFNGIPQIATRDTQTTVALQEDQTLVIGGLIQESNSRTDTKIPLLGDLPLIGKAFRENQLNTQRNELIITVTPHIITPPQSLAPPRPIASLPEQRSATSSGVVVPPPAASRPLLSPRPAASPSAVPGAPAFPSLNTFKYGAIPQNNFAKPTDPVQIFYATFAPTVLGKNQVVLLNVITSTNVQRVALAYGTFTQPLAQLSSGQWQARFALGPSALPPPPANVSLTLSAARADGSSTSIAIPVSVAP